MEEHQYISFENYFVDGTKLEADARKHSQVWRKNTERYKAGVQKRIESLMEEIDDLNTNEDKIYNKKDLPELGEQSNISSEQVKKVADSIDKKLADKQKEKTISKKKARQVKSKIKKLTQEKDKLQNYEKQEENLGERNSYSKTDVDATMMRMKGSDELRPGYNVQVSSENQFAVEVSVGQNASDSVCFPEHLRRSQERGENFVPSNYVGDAGYGSEENYELLEQEKIGNHLMFPTFSYEQTEKHKNNIFHRDNMPYNRELDCFVCPNSVNLSFKETIIKTNKNGFKQEVRVYQSEGCDGCQFKEKCTKAKGNRTIQVNEKLERHKDITRENLNSPQGEIFRKMRGFEIETFFGDLKHNQKYRRIRLRGLSNALLEMSWLAISYNLRKLNIAVIEELA